MEPCNSIFTFFLLQDESQLDGILSARKDKLLACGLFMQPIPVIVGESLQKITKYYVVINNIKYIAASTLDAIDKTFKSCYSLQLDFSKIAVYPWSILQEHVYELKGECDINRPAVATLINDLKQYKA